MKKETSLTLAVDPRLRHFPTGLEVAPGERYRFSAEGQWKDWRRTCGPEGWSFWPLQFGNRLPGQPFFLLCGSVGATDRYTFPIGEGGEWTVPAEAASLADRQLYLFANDWCLLYFNNHAMSADEGHPLTVTITKLGDERTHP